MALEGQGISGSAQRYAEYQDTGLPIGQGGQVPPAGKDGNAGRAYLEDKIAKEASEPDAKTNRIARATTATEREIQAGQNVQKTGAAIMGAAGTVLTVGSVISAGANVVPVFGQIASAAGFLTTLFIAGCVMLAGGIVTAIGKGMVNKAQGKKDLQLDDVNKGLQDAASAAEKAKMLKKKNRIEVDRQQLGSLETEIAKQKEYMGTLDPESPKYERAQKTLDRMNTSKGQYEARISEYEASATAQGTGGGAATAPQSATDAELPMTPAAAGADGGDLPTAQAIDVAGNPSASTATSGPTAAAPAATLSP